MSITKAHLLTKMKKILSLIAISICLVACSGSSSDSNYNENDAQKVYNQMKGTYVGQMLIDNLPQSVKIILADDFTFKQIPLKPILGRIFNEKTELDEALQSALTQSIDFVAPTSELNVNNYQILLTMKQTDLIFTVKVGGNDHRIIATINSTALKSMPTNGLSIYLDIKELNCNGKDYDVKKEPLTYFIDSAHKEQIK